MGSELTVGDIMTKNVITVEMGKTVEEAAKMMQKHKIGSVIVVEEKHGKKAKGIITERDIVHKLIAKRKDPYKVTVEEVMTTPLRVVKPETLLEEAARAMRENRIKRLPVVNQKNEIVGIISEGDVMRIFPAVIEMLEEKVAIGL